MHSYLVTGANRGLGLEFVRQLSEVKDNNVFALVRDRSKATTLLQLEHERINVQIIEGDVTELSSLKVAAEEVKRLTGGSLNVLINNAGLTRHPHRAWTLDEYINENQKYLEEDIIHNMQVNTIGPINVINAFLPLLRTASVASTARVVAISSGLADLETTTRAELGMQAPYSMSKIALNMAIAKYAATFKDDNFVFLSISPGFVKTAEEPSNPQELAWLNEMLKGFKKVFPDWDMQPLSAEASVRLMLDLIGKWEKADSGAIISHKGNKEWF